MLKRQSGQSSGQSLDTRKSPSVLAPVCCSLKAGYPMHRLGWSISQHAAWTATLLPMLVGCPGIKVVAGLQTSSANSINKTA